MILENLELSLWAVIEIAVVVGIAYGILKVKTQATSQRLNELEKEALALDAAMQIQVPDLALEIAHHKQDTTDRLARIETKLDVLLQKDWR
jgi:uncharacterized membrane-anchored protein YhcB (DUF1043 family)